MASASERGRPASRKEARTVEGGGASVPVGGEQEHRREHERAPGPAGEGEVFVPEQPDPEGGEHGFDVADDRGLHLTDEPEAPPVGEVRARVDAAIRSFALEEYRGRAPQYLSGGEKKRVTLADALAMEPQMLLLDEPAASLDPANTRLLEQNLQMLSEQGLGLMVATHDVDFAWRWATRVLVFRGGRLAGDGEPREIFENVSLLRTCGLDQPVLYRVGRVLGLAAPPHTVEELEQEWKP